MSPTLKELIQSKLSAFLDAMLAKSKQHYQQYQFEFSERYFNMRCFLTDLVVQNEGDVRHLRITLGHHERQGVDTTHVAFKLYKNTIAGYYKCQSDVLEKKFLHGLSDAIYSGELKLKKEPFAALVSNALASRYESLDEWEIAEEDTLSPSANAASAHA